MERLLYSTRLITFLGLVSVLTLSAGGVVYAQTVSPTRVQEAEQDDTATTAEAPTQGLNLTLSPTYISLTTDPGKEVNSQFRVTNNNNFSESLIVSVAKLEVGADGRPVLADITPQDEFGEWIEVQDTSFTLSPNSSRNVRFSIAPTEDASLGYYYTLLVSRASEGNEAGTTPQAVVAGSAAITVLLDVKSPNAKRELQISKFATDKIFFEYLPVTFSVNVKNTGNVHVIPFGDIFIDSLFHKEIAVLPANPGRGNVLPQSEREFTAVWADGFAVRERKMENGVPVKNDKGEEVYSTNYDFQKANEFRAGKYTATLVMVYDNGERDIPIEATVSFWVIPWKILGIGLVVLIFALIGIKNTLFSYGKKLSGLFGRKK